MNLYDAMTAAGYLKFPDGQVCRIRYFDENTGECSFIDDETLDEYEWTLRDLVKHQVIPCRLEEIPVIYEREVKSPVAGA